MKPYGRVVDGDGTPLGSPFALEATAADQVDVTVGKQDANDDLFLAYTDNRNGNPDLYGERYTPPIAGFISTPPSGNAPLTVVFTDTSTAPNGISEWQWDFGDGTSGSTLQNPTHQYRAVGPHTVALTIDSGSEADRATQVITINTPVTAQFVASPLSGAKPLTVTFTDQSNTTCGAINSWLWDLGDGVTSTQQNPVHAYEGLGNYTAVLTASASAYSDTETKTGYVSVVLPTTTVISYAYDGLYRVTSAEYSSGESFEYQYDAVGNRLAYTETLTAQVVTTYTYDAANRLTTAKASDDPILWHYTSDANGNLIEVTPNGTVPAAVALQYTYNQANWLISVERHTGSAYQSQASMVYDGVGQRLSVTAWQGSTSLTSRYVIDSARKGAVLAATANGQTTYYLYGYGVIAEQTATWAHYLKDGQTTVRQLTDAAGVVTFARTAREEHPQLRIHVPRP